MYAFYRAEVKNTTAGILFCKNWGGKKPSQNGIRAVTCVKFLSFYSSPLHTSLSVNEWLHSEKTLRRQDWETVGKHWRSKSNIQGSWERGKPSIHGTKPRKDKLRPRRLAKSRCFELRIVRCPGPILPAPCCLTNMRPTSLWILTAVFSSYLGIVEINIS